MREESTKMVKDKLQTVDSLHLDELISLARSQYTIRLSVLKKSKASFEFLSFEKLVDRLNKNGPVARLYQSKIVEAFIKEDNDSKTVSVFGNGIKGVKGLVLEDPNLEVPTLYMTVFEKKDCLLVLQSFCAKKDFDRGNTLQKEEAPLTCFGMSRPDKRKNKKGETKRRSKKALALSNDLDTFLSGFRGLCENQKVTKVNISFKENLLGSDDSLIMVNDSLAYLGKLDNFLKDQLMITINKLFKVGKVTLQDFEWLRLHLSKGGKNED